MFIKIIFEKNGTIIFQIELLIELFKDVINQYIEDRSSEYTIEHEKYFLDVQEKYCMSLHIQCCE